MKHKFLLLIGFVLIGTVLVIISCSRRDAAPIPESIIEIPSLVYGEGARIGDFQLPDETFIQLTEKGFEFTFPEGFQLAYLKESYGLVITDGGQYTCTCSESDGCTVFWHKERGFGCLQSTCTGTCTGGFVEPEIVTTGVVINHNQPFKFINSGDDLNSYFTFKSTLLEIPYVIETIKEINLKYYGKEILTEEDYSKNDYTLVPISIYGNLVGYALPNEYYYSKGGGPTVTCECIGTGGGTTTEDCDEPTKEGFGVWTCPNITCDICKMDVIEQE